MIRQVESGHNIQMAKKQAEIDLLKKELCAAACNQLHETISANQDIAACHKDCLAQELIDQAGE